MKLTILNYSIIAKKEDWILSTVFDESSAIFLNKLGLKIFKIPSGEINNYLLLKIGSFKKEVILSTGMSNIQEIEDAIKFLLNLAQN